MNKKYLKEILERLYLNYRHKFSSKDPVWMLHRFSDEGDIETAGLITSCYTYGQVDQINLFMMKFFEKINFKVHEFTSNYSEHKDKKFIENLNYRFNTSDDLSLLLINIKETISKYGSLKNLFAEKYDPDEINILNPLRHFTFQLNRKSNSDSNYSYLIPTPDNKSACKRLNLFLRWMVRKDEIDPGIWSDVINKSKLLMPVDTHIYRISSRLKLVKRKSCDLKFALELTGKLKEFDVTDPIKYDFALCHAGIGKEIDLIFGKQKS